MKVLVTGGAGFIGSNLVRSALQLGYEIRVIDDLSTGHAQNIDGLEVDFRQASILDSEALIGVMEGVDAVVHLAALGSVPRSIHDPTRTHEVNATGTLAVLTTARDAGVANVITASSSSVYGLNPALPKRERDWVRPMSPYAVSKLAAEQYTLAFQQSYDMATTAFRFFNVYGPRQAAGHAYAAVIPVFLDAILAGRPLTINGDGSTSRDFTFVATVSDVILKAVENPKARPEPINLAFGTNTRLLDLVRKLEQIAEKDARVLFGPTRARDVPHSQADATMLTNLFPTVRPVLLDDGLRQTMKWFLEQETPHDTKE